MTVQVSGVAATSGQLQTLRRDIGVAYADAYVMPAATGVAATDTAAIAAALADSAQVVHFTRPGTYLLNAQQTWPSNKWLVSTCAWGEVIIKAADATNLNWMFVSASSAHDFGATNITFDANTAGQSSGSNGGCDLTVGVCYAIKFEKCWFKNAKSNPCITFYGDTTTIQDHLITECQFGPTTRRCLILTNVNGVAFSNCLFYDFNTAVVSEPGISIQNSSRNITIDRCTFRPLVSTQFGVEIATSSGAYSSLSVTNCFLDANGVGGTGISGSISNSVFANNRFVNGTFGDRSGFEIAGDNNVIVGNYMENTQLIVTEINNGAASGMGNGNVIDSNTLSLTSASVTSISGIHLLCQSNCVVSNNTVKYSISGTATIQSGIYIGTFGANGPLRNIVVSNNTCVSNSVLGQGIRLLTGVGVNANVGTDWGVNVSIENNKVYGFLSGITLPSTANDSDIVVRGNTFLQCTNGVNGYSRGKGCYVAENKILEGESMRGTTQRKSSGYTVVNSDHTILCSTGSGFTVTLPVWPGQGQEIVIKKVTSDANTLTIAHNANALDVGLGGALANLSTAATTYPSFVLRAVQSALTATMTIASPGVVTVTGHTLVPGQAVIFTTTGALPTGVTLGTIYYAGNISGSTFNLYDTSANGITGGATGRIDTTGTQSGTHTCLSNAWWLV